MCYIHTTLEESFSINDIYSIRYFEYMNDFFFPGERHDFWEFACVDKGEVYIRAEDQRILLKRNDIIFHQPNEFHSVEATGTIAPNLVVVSFACKNPAMDFFSNQLLKIDATEQRLLANIIIEAKNTFSSPLDNPYLLQMSKRQDAPFASEQLLKLYLEELLIHLSRRYQNRSSAAVNDSLSPPKVMNQRAQDELLKRVMAYMEAHIAEQITLSSICRDNLAGQSQLEKIFHEKLGLGVIEYFTKMKIDTAKQMIRNNQLNFSQISEKLGYSSIHYFSRQFKKMTGMTPSEYSTSVKAISETHG